jgi:hypothetical protein
MSLVGGCLPSAFGFIHNTVPQLDARCTRCVSREMVSEVQRELATQCLGEVPVTTSSGCAFPDQRVRVLVRLFSLPDAGTTSPFPVHVYRFASRVRLYYGSPCRGCGLNIQASVEVNGGAGPRIFCRIIDDSGAEGVHLDIAETNPESEIQTSDKSGIGFVRDGQCGLFGCSELGRNGR